MKNTARTTPTARLTIAAQALLMLGVSVALGLLACEALVRYLRPQLLYRYPQGLYVNDAELGYRLNPGFSDVFETPEYTTHVHVNNQGLREDREYGPKEPDVFRILAIGDSFTMGHSVEAPETFVKELNRLLGEGRSAHVARYEVLNAGVPGYNTAQEIGYLERRGVALEPDLVLLIFFVGNDIHDNAAHTSTVRVEDGYLVDTVHPQGILPYSLRRFVTLHSHLYHFLWPYQRTLLRRGVEEFERDETERLAIYATDGVAGAWWEATARQIARLGALVASGAVPRVAAVIIPDPLQVQADPARIPAGARNETRYDLDLPSNRVGALFTAQGIPTLDLLPSFRAASSTTPLYFAVDGHLTRAGNAIAARAILGFLRNEELVQGGNRRAADLSRHMRSPRPSRHAVLPS
jgi:hypothetical protein